MSVTEKLLRVFRVDQQLVGLQSRLRAAERFLEEQSRQLAELQTRHDSLGTQLKQMLAMIADHEGEVARLEARIEHLRDQMNNAKTNKEYKAFLVEVNTLKADRDRAEQAALELMTKADELRKQQSAVDAQRTEREKVKDVAAGDREKRADEIRDRVNQLSAERDKLRAEVPEEALRLYAELVRQRGEEAMAPVEEQDRRRHEATCGSCMMSLPVETVNSLIKGGQLTRCVSCGCLLYIEKELAEAMQPGTNKRGASV